MPRLAMRPRMSGMQGLGDGRHGCVRCSRPFGFAVPHCPFCGAAQRPLQPGSVPDMRARPIPQPVPPIRPAPVSEVQAAPAPPVAAVRAAEPRPAGPAAKKASRQAGRPTPPRNYRAVAFLAVLVVAAWFMTGHRPAQAVLVVSVQPAADGAVLVDGKRTGRAGERLQLPAGSHTIGFDADGWSAPTRQVALAANQRRTLRLELTPRPALLTLRPDPADATLRLDGRLLDTTQDEHRVTPGWHHLVATHPGFMPLTLPMMLGRGERRVIPLRLSPLPVRKLTFQAPVGTWSDPVTLPAGTGFTLAFNGRLRLRIGHDVYLVGPAGSINLGDVRARTMQMKAVDDRPVAVRLLLRSEDRSAVL